MAAAEFECAASVATEDSCCVGAGSQFFAELVLALFVALEDFAGAVDDAAREAGEAGDFDAVGFVGAAGFDVAKEDDFVGSFFYGDVDVGDGGEEIGELGEFVIVRGEEGASASVLLQMLDDGPGDREAVEGGGAAADFVEEDEAGGSGVVEDAGDFAHFDEEGGAAAGEIVGGADAGEDAVDQRELGLAGGNEGAHLRHQRDQRGLAEVGGLAAHVGAGDQQELLAARLEAEIVGDEALAALAEEFFDDGMAAGDDEEFAASGEFGAGVAAVGGEFGEGGEDVELGDGAGGFAQARGLRGDAGADFDEELAFDFADAFVGGEDFAFVVFEFGAGEAFGVD